jgi:hypothetical protein
MGGGSGGQPAPPPHDIERNFVNAHVDVEDVLNPAHGVTGRIGIIPSTGPLLRLPGAARVYPHLFSSRSGSVWGWWGASPENLEQEIRDLLAVELGEVAKSIPLHRFTALVEVLRSNAGRRLVLAFNRVPTPLQPHRVGVWLFPRDAFEFHNHHLAAAWVEQLALAYDAGTEGRGLPLALVGDGPTGSAQSRAAS